MEEAISLTPSQIHYLKIFTTMRMAGMLIPMHTDALAAICRQENSPKFVNSLALVWFMLFVG